MKQKNYTLISDLNELPDISDENMIPNEMNSQVRKLIRNPHQLSSQSGMVPPKNQMYNEPPMNSRQYQEQMNRQILMQPPQSLYAEQPQYPPPLRENYEHLSPESYNCRDIAEHLENCTVCGRLYNNDKMNTIYIIIIVFLCLIILLLLKRVLGV
jgi:hypothetical protein